MRTITRAGRALIRSPLRGILLVGVLGVSIGLALIMITVNGAFATRLDDIRASVGTDITVRPAGTFGGGAFRFGGDRGANGGNTTPNNNSTQTTTQPTLTDADLQKLTSISHVASITRVVTERYTGNTLVAPTIQPPAGANINGQNAPNGFTPPIIVTGTDNPNTLASLISSDTQITSGRTFDASDSGTNVAVVGESLASTNNLTVGDTFTLTDTNGNPVTITVIGIYTTGTTFGDNAIALPIDTARTIFARSNQVDEAVVRADSVDSVDQVANDVKTTLGTNVADVTTGQSVFTAISSPLSDAKNSSEIGMWAALIASAIIILFSIGLVARQRIREIGILKAIGASSWNVVGQFSVETAAIAVAAALVGALATFPLAQTVANNLVTGASASGPQGLGGRGGGAGAFFVGGGGAAARASGLLGNVNVAVSADVFLYAIAIAIGLALLATIVPAWYVGRVRPAEVLRHE